MIVIGGYVMMIVAVIGLGSGNVVAVVGVVLSFRLEEHLPLRLQLQNMK